jgi:hypothetical protein
VIFIWEAIAEQSVDCNGVGRDKGMSASSISILKKSLMIIYFRQVTRKAIVNAGHRVR